MILAYLPVWKSVNLFDACLATSLDKLLLTLSHYKIMQNYFSIQFLWVVKSLWLTSKKIPLSMRLLVLILSMFYWADLCSR